MSHARMPGFVPALNKRAVELGIIAGLVTNCEITPRITFDKRIIFILIYLRAIRIHNYMRLFAEMVMLKLKQNQARRKYV